MKSFPTARDASLSVWQSVIAKYADKLEPGVRDAIKNATDLYVTAADPHDTRTEDEAREDFRSEASIQVTDALKDISDMSALYHQLAQAKASRNTQAERLVADQIQAHQNATAGISVFDWAKPLAEFLKYYGLAHNKKPEYRSWENEGAGDRNYSVVEWVLPPNARVAILSDWGTGREEAVQVLKAACQHKPDAIIHLGDIYFSGNQQECQENFLKLMTAHAVGVDGQKLPVFTLAGNHDYYSGGGGYLWLLDNLNQGSQTQRASYFCLRTQDGGWQFLAGDTGYNDHVLGLSSLKCPGTYLQPDEVNWHLHKLAGVDFHGRTILLTHHQAFSANEKIMDTDEHHKDSVNQTLIGTFKSFLDKIPLWLWGHEHILMIYKDGFQGVQKGRCVGNGAIPDPSHGDKKYTRPTYPDVPFNPAIRPGTTHGKYNHGYAIIELGGSGQPGKASYYEVVPTGNEGFVSNQLYNEGFE